MIEPYSRLITQRDGAKSFRNYIKSSDIREDVCALYLEVLEDLWNVDSGLNSEISQIGIDLSELSHLTEVEKDTVMSEFASKNNLPLQTNYSLILLQFSVFAL